MTDNQRLTMAVGGCGGIHRDGVLRYRRHRDGEVRRRSTGKGTPPWPADAQRQLSKLLGDGDGNGDGNGNGIGGRQTSGGWWLRKWDCAAEITRWQQ